MESIIFSIIIIIWFCIYIYFQFLPKIQKQRYELRSDFFNRSEFIFYQMLEDKLPKNFMVFAKTRIEDFIRVKSQKDNSTFYSLRGFIKSRHVDFLICNEHGNPKLAIEIDGGSHNAHERQERDSFLDKIYHEVWLNIIHIRVGENFETKIQEIILKLQDANP